MKAPNRYVPYPTRLGVAVGLVSGCVLGTSTLRAELTWPTKNVELHADARATVLEARFPFTNDGTTPVDIRQVQTSCGCTTATLEQRHFEPGQHGEIVTRYTVGEHVGPQKKMILVSASDHPFPTTLTLTVYIPELVHIQPPSVTWQPGESTVAKIIGIEAVQAATTLRDVSVQSSNPVLKAQLQPGAAPGKYQISVVPAATDRPVFTMLTIRCHVGAEEKTFHAFASVQAALPSPGMIPPGNRPAILPAATPPTPTPVGG